jgi:hypothetical protein
MRGETKKQSTMLSLRTPNERAGTAALKSESPADRTAPRLAEPLWFSRSVRRQGSWVALHLR